MRSQAVKEGVALTTIGFAVDIGGFAPHTVTVALAIAHTAIRCTVLCSVTGNAGGGAHTGKAGAAAAALAAGAASGAAIGGEPLEIDFRPKDVKF